MGTLRRPGPRGRTAIVFGGAAAVGGATREWPAAAACTRAVVFGPSDEPDAALAAALGGLVGEDAVSFVGPDSAAPAPAPRTLVVALYGEPAPAPTASLAAARAFARAAGVPEAYVAFDAGAVESRAGELTGAARAALERRREFAAAPAPFGRYGHDGGAWKHARPDLLTRAAYSMCDRRFDGALHRAGAALGAGGDDSCLLVLADARHALDPRSDTAMQIAAAVDTGAPLRPVAVNVRPRDTDALLAALAAKRSSWGATPPWEAGGWPRAPSVTARAAYAALRGCAAPCTPARMLAAVRAAAGAAPGGADTAMRELLAPVREAHDVTATIEAGAGAYAADVPLCWVVTAEALNDPACAGAERGSGAQCVAVTGCRDAAQYEKILDVLHDDYIATRGPDAALTMGYETLRTRANLGGSPPPFVPGEPLLGEVGRARTFALPSDEPSSSLALHGDDDAGFKAALARTLLTAGPVLRRTADRPDAGVEAVAEMYEQEAELREPGMFAEWCAARGNGRACRQRGALLEPGREYVDAYRMARDNGIDLPVDAPGADLPARYRLLLLRLRAATHDAYIDTDDAVHPFLRPSERALSGE